jgi:hypothetical protein
MRKLFWIVVFLQLNVDISFSQMVWECNTNSNTPDILKTILLENYVSPRTTYTIRVNAHIIRKSDGSGGVSLGDVNDALSEMIDLYSLHQIYFCVNEINDIRNDYLYLQLSYQVLTQSLQPNGKYSILDLYSSTDRIDIFFFPENDGYLFTSAFASGIPGTTVILGGYFLSGRYLAHELGHCLGLYHTFHGLCETGCPELVNGSNCNDCGDYVCDTPPDPAFRFYYNCFWTGETCDNISDHDLNGDLYQPDPYNIMSYAMDCFQYFTIGQSDRVKNIISNSQILQSTIIPESYHLYNQTLYSGNSYYYSAQNELIIEETIVQPYSNTEVKSWNRIIIKTGTKIKQGASFHAYIQQCISPLLVKTESFEYFDSQGDGVKTQLEEQNKEHIIVYPNPSPNGKFYLFTNNNDDKNIKISDISGNIVYNNNTNRNNTDIDISSFQTGIYFLTVSDQQNITNFKLVKE